MAVRADHADRDGEGACGSRSARAAAPSAPASSRKSWSSDWKGKGTRCATSSPWRAPSASSATTRRRRTRGRTPDKLELKKFCPFVPQAHGAQGNRSRRLRSGRRPVALTARAPVSKTGGWGFESLLACHPSRGYGSFRKMAKTLKDRLLERLPGTRTAARRAGRRFLGASVDKVKGFLQEFRTEMKKVSWPARKETCVHRGGHRDRADRSWRSWGWWTSPSAKSSSPF